jgi:hypothetical protein
VKRLFLFEQIKQQEKGRTTMHLNPDVYDYRNLKESDKEQIDTLEAVKTNVLNKDVVEDFVDTKDISGATLQNIYREVLNEFVSFLSERVEYVKVDMIVEKIEGYSDDEFESLYNAAKLKRNKPQAVNA